MAAEPMQIAQVQGGSNMAKYRHRLFEMYENPDEAIRALTSNSDLPGTEFSASETWDFAHLMVSRSDRVTRVAFKSGQTSEQESLSGLREDFTQLADKLARNSRVLLDFAGLTSFSDSSLESLALFNRKLQTKGSRMALCCLEPAARECFFRRPFAVDLEEDFRVNRRALKRL
jgi:anti-anti-sigma regulatory factor